MAPFLISTAQSRIDEYRKEMLVKEYLAKQATLSTPAPANSMSDESSLHIEKSEFNESADVSLDQLNHGFSLVNIHWASSSRAAAISGGGVSVKPAPVILSCSTRSRLQPATPARLPHLSPASTLVSSLPPLWPLPMSASPSSATLRPPLLLPVASRVLHLVRANVHPRHRPCRAVPLPPGLPRGFTGGHVRQTRAILRR